MKKETKKEIASYAISSLMLFAFSLIFSLFSLIFFIDKIPNVVQFLISFIFIAPTFYIAFVQGRHQGERLFKANFRTTLNDLHSEHEIKIPYYKCIFYVLGFIVPLIILLIVAVIAKSTSVRLIVLAFEFPVALMFSSINVLNMKIVTPLTLAVFVPYTLLIAGMFILGYVLKILALRRQHANIESEIRMFDN